MIYRFSKFEIDTGNYQLRNDWIPVTLEPKVFDLLHFLIVNRQKLVTRDELFENLWAGRSVSDTSLSNQIRAARKAICDDGTRQSCIKTMHGRGYQFIAEIQEVEQESTTIQPGTTPNVAGKKPVSHPSIAVLSFANLSGDAQYDPICDAIADDILTGLCRFRNLLVRSHGTAPLLEDKTANPVETAVKLGADYLLEGSIRIVEDWVRITTQLVDGTTGNHLWAESYDRKVEDYFSVNDSVAQKIIAALAIRLANSGLSRDLRMPSDYSSGFCVPYTIRISPDKGWGVFTDAEVSKGVILWRHTRGRYVVYDERTLKEFLDTLSHSEVVYELNHMFGVPEFPDHVIRVFDNGELINHSRQPTAVVNSLDRNFEAKQNISCGDVADALLDDHFALVVKRDLKAGDEITLDYTVGAEDPVYFDNLCGQYGVSWPWF